MTTFLTWPEAGLTSGDLMRPLVLARAEKLARLACCCCCCGSCSGRCWSSMAAFLDSWLAWFSSLCLRFRPVAETLQACGWFMRDRWGTSPLSEGGSYQKGGPKQAGEDDLPMPGRCFFSSRITATDASPFLRPGSLGSQVPASARPLRRRRDGMAPSETKNSKPALAVGNNRWWPHDATEDARRSLRRGRLLVGYQTRFFDSRTATHSGGGGRAALSRGGPHRPHTEGHPWMTSASRVLIGCWVSITLLKANPQAYLALKNLCNTKFFRIFFRRFLRWFLLFDCFTSFNSSNYW